MSENPSRPLRTSCDDVTTNGCALIEPNMLNYLSSASQSISEYVYSQPLVNMRPKPETASSAHPTRNHHCRLIEAQMTEG